MSKILRNLEIEEVSLVDKAANKRRFFVIKNDQGEPVYQIDRFEKSAKTKIRIDSDGSIAGTTIKVNGEEVSPLEVAFNFYKFDETDNDSSVYFHYLTVEKDDKGDFQTLTNHILMKKDGFSHTSKALSQEEVEAIKNFTEADLETIDEVKAQLLAKQLEVLADYKEIAPIDVREAITTLTGIAVSGKIEQIVEKQEGENEMDEIVEEAQQEEKVVPTAEIDYEKLAGLVAAKLAEQAAQAVVEPEVKVVEEVVVEPVVVPETVEIEQPVGEVDEEVDMSVQEFAELIVGAATSGS